MSKTKYKIELVDADYYRRQIACQSRCPVQTNARGYVLATASGNYEEAYVAARQPNPLVSTCAWVCNSPCESACRRGNIDAPVSIRAIKRFLTDRYGVESIMRLPQMRVDGKRVGYKLLGGTVPSNSQTKWSVAALTAAGQKKKQAGNAAPKVAVIWAGPAGLAAAHDLALMGYRVTIIEAAPVPGGMLVLGVPEYRLRRELVRMEIEQILGLGVELKLNTPLGKDLTLQNLKEQGYEAIFISTGLYKGRSLNIEGVNLDGVMLAVDFLLNVNRGYQVDLGQRIAVIGGGAVAMDAARIAARVGEAEHPTSGEDIETALEAARRALRLGAREVHIFCLESKDEMPAGEEEVEDALEEGVILHDRQGPKRILGYNGKVAGLETIQVHSVFDSQGKFNPTFIPDSESITRCDTIIMAVGQTSDLSFISEEDGIQVTRQGIIQVDSETLATTAPGIFAGGDVAFGPRIIIDVEAHGHKAAASIDHYLSGRKLKTHQRAWMTKENIDPGNRTRLDLPRERPPMLSLDRRVGIAEVEQVYSEDVAREQAKRCLKCHIQTVFNSDLCILCGGCIDVCPQNCLKMVNLDKLEGDETFDSVLRARYGFNKKDFQGADANPVVLTRGTAIIKDETLCTRCSFCEKRCPVGAITMESFWFEEEIVYEDNVKDTQASLAGVTHG